MKYECGNSKRLFYDVEGQHKCQRSTPFGSTRVWFQRTHTGRGTIYLFPTKPAAPVTRDYAERAFGWIDEYTAQNIRLQGDQGYCNYWEEIAIRDSISSRGHDMLEGVIEFTDNLELSPPGGSHGAARATNFTFQVGPWKEDPAQLQLKETKMDYGQKTAGRIGQTNVSNIVENNKQAMQSAGFLEAGRIANKELSKALGPLLPVFMRGYADTPVGRLALANMAQVAAQHFKPSNAALQKLVAAMTTQAYAEVIQTAGVEEFVEKLLANDKIKGALASVSSD